MRRLKMVEFGENSIRAFGGLHSYALPLAGRQPSPVLMLRASQFLREEMPIRLAHRVAELENLPYELSSMPSVIKVKDWYAKSFQDLLEFPSAEAYGIPSSFTNNRRKDVAALLNGGNSWTRRPCRPKVDTKWIAPTSDQSPYALHNVKKAAQQQTTSKFFGRLFGSSKGEENVSPNVVSTQSPRPQPEEVDEDPPLVVGSYYAPMKNEPKEVIQAVLDYNQQFANCLEAIKRRHDPVVSTVGTLTPACRGAC